MQESEQKDRLKQKWSDYIREQEEDLKPSSSPDVEAKETPLRIVKKQKSLRRGQGEKWKSELVNPVLRAKLNRFRLVLNCHRCKLVQSKNRSKTMNDLPSAGNFKEMYRENRQTSFDATGAIEEDPSL